VLGSSEGSRCWRTSLMGSLVYPAVRPYDPEDRGVSDDSRLSEGMSDGPELQRVPVSAPRVQQHREVGLSSVMCAPWWNAYMKGYRVAPCHRSTCIETGVIA
jgi:hypothetical protein